MEETCKSLIKQHCYKKNNSVNGRCNDKQWWINKNLVNLYDSILRITDFLPNNTNMNVRFYHIMNDVYMIPKCKVNDCNNLVTWHTSINNYSEFCSPKCNSITNKKTGSDNTFSKTETKEKIKNTNLEKYGVDNYAKSNTFSQRMKKFHQNLPSTARKNINTKRINTNIERYGVTSPLLNSDVIKKIKNTLVEKYNVDSPLKSKKILDKLKTTTLARYGTTNYLQSHLDPNFLEKLKNRDWVLSQLDNKSLKQLATENNISYSNLCSKVNLLGIDLNNYSYFEKEVTDYIKMLGIADISTHDKKILQGKEVDIFLPNLNIGIECDGVYWHSEKKGKDKNYHLEKTLLARNNGVKLIHIFENEWLFKQDIVKSRLSTLLGKNKTIYARKLKLETVSTNLERCFLEENHLQGYVNSKICYGLFDSDNQLVSMMSFGKSRFTNTSEWELIRYSAKNNYSVVGGASRLLSHFKKNYTPLSIISYCDLRWFTGEMYRKIGFSFDHNSTPNYFYIETDGSLSSRLKYQKHKLKTKLNNFDPQLTEWQNMQINGFDRIWDCGNSVWIWKR